MARAHKDKMRVHGKDTQRQDEGSWRERQSGNGVESSREDLGELEDEEGRGWGGPDDRPVERGRRHRAGTHGSVGIPLGCPLGRTAPAVDRPFTVHMARTRGLDSMDEERVRQRFELPQLPQRQGRANDGGADWGSSFL